MQDAIGVPANEGPATPGETLEDLLSRSRRSAVPIRRTLLQSGGRSHEPGPLRLFVAERRRRALDQYLLLHAGASAEPWDVTQPAMSWARMMRMEDKTSSEVAVSRNWRWLEAKGLVKTKRSGRLIAVYLLAEDGSGREYTRPRGREEGSEHGYFNLPFEYFRQRWDGELSLASKATLLICLAQAPTFDLPTERAAGWYGISADTLQRGLDELRSLGLLQSWGRTKKAPRTRRGWTTVNYYRLGGPFSPTRARRKTAAIEDEATEATSTGAKTTTTTTPTSAAATTASTASKAASVAGAAGLSTSGPVAGATATSPSSFPRRPRHSSPRARWSP